MTKEEKAKAYDYALEILHKYDGAHIMFTQDLKEEMFPELSKSDDERIRKELLEEIEFIIPHEDETDSEGLILPSYRTRIKRYKSYLEKQKEQTEDLSTRLNGVMQEYVKAGKDEEEQEHRLKCYQLFWDALGDSEFFKQKEQKPAEWSEEDDKTLNHIINVLDALGYEEYCTSSRDQDVEEERLYYNEIQVLKKLKSLRPPQYCENCKLKRSVENWKPSKEQMDTLRDVVINLQNIPWAYNPLKELYKQLNKQ